VRLRETRSTADRYVDNLEHCVGQLEAREQKERQERRSTLERLERERRFDEHKRAREAWADCEQEQAERFARERQYMNEVERKVYGQYEKERRARFEHEASMWETREADRLHREVREELEADTDARTSGRSGNMTSLDALLAAHEDVTSLLQEAGVGVGGSRSPAAARQEGEEQGDMEEALEHIAALRSLRRQLTAATRRHTAATSALCHRHLRDVTAWCQEAVEHLDALSGRKQLLAHYLQLPAPPSCLTLPRPCHALLRQVLHELTKVVSEAHSRTAMLALGGDAGPALDRCTQELGAVLGGLRGVWAAARALGVES